MVVIGILAALAAILFPVFARAKERAKLNDCQSRLRQFSLALQMYRADHDGVGMPIVIGLPNHYPYNDYLPIEPYLRPGTQLWCPVPSRSAIVAYDFLHYRTQPYRPPSSAKVWASPPFEPAPGMIEVYCNNHTSDARDVRSINLYVGRYQFAREDGSAGSTTNDRIAPWYVSEAGWSQKSTPTSGEILQFPGETFPLKAQF